MLIYSAVVPTSPLLLKELAGEHYEKLSTTHAAVARVGEELALLKPDAIIVITANAERYKDALSASLHDPYEAVAQAYGDMGLKQTFKPHMQLIDRIKRAAREEGRLFTMTTNDVLDPGSSIPLLALGHYIENTKIVVVTPPAAGAKEVVFHGEIVRNALMDLEGRYAVICCADLSHGHSEVASGGEHPLAEEIDNRVRNALIDGNSLGLINIAQEDLVTVSANDVDAVRLMWGIVDDTEYEAHEYAYEHPFGVGLLTMVLRPASL